MSKFIVYATWDDAPHLTAEAKTELWKAIPPHQRDARSKGIPTLGSGAIYPVSESSILVDPFELPRHWPRAYGLDVGWNRTAGIWGAEDRDSRTVYLYAEHYFAHSEPSDNARAIRGRGEWIKGVIDPAARGRGQRDGQQLIQNYLDLGLKIEPAENAVQSGLDQVWNLLIEERLKVFKSCSSWLREFRTYHRDDKGHVVKKDDHLMDATRYLIVSGREHMTVEPLKDKGKRGRGHITGGWAG